MTAHRHQLNLYTSGDGDPLIIDASSISEVTINSSNARPLVMQLPVVNTYPVFTKTSPFTDSNDSNQLMAATNIVNSGIYNRVVTENRVDQWPTATQLLAEIPAPSIGTTFSCCFNNLSTDAGSAVISWVAGTGVSFVTTSQLRKFGNTLCTCVVTSISPDLIDIYATRGSIVDL